MELTAELMLAISKDISRRFAPMAGSVIDDGNGLVIDSRLRSPSPCYAGHAIENAGHSSHNGRISMKAQELLRISEDINRRFQLDRSDDASELVLLPVDPNHVYAYWHLNEIRHDALVNGDFLKNMALRIYWQPDGNLASSTSNVWFDAAIDSSSGLKKIALPVDDSFYSAALGKIDSENRFCAYLFSNCVHIPSAARLHQQFFEPEQSRKIDNPGEIKINKMSADVADPDNGMTVANKWISKFLTKRNLRQIADKGWYFRLMDCGSLKLTERHGDWTTFIDHGGNHIQLFPGPPGVKRELSLEQTVSSLNLRH